MQAGAGEGAFRLIVRTDAGDRIFAERVFPDFQTAQACVAQAVRAHSLSAHVREVQLQEATARLIAPPLALTAPSRLAIADRDSDAVVDVWRVRARWNGPVVDRILLQGRLTPVGSVALLPHPRPARPNAIFRPPSARGPLLTPRRAPALLAGPALGSQPAPVAKPAAHRPMRWDIAAACLLFATAMGAFMLIQTEGGRALAAAGDRSQPIVRFDGLIYSPEAPARYQLSSSDVSILSQAYPLRR